MPSIFSPSSGSSPRLRGTESPVPYALRCSRFIPATAGNGPAANRVIGAIPVHPRDCGERSSPSSVLILMIGSSPRLRGTDDRRRRGLRRSRFIPATAGNGAACLAKAFCLSGSSPRLRGTEKMNSKAKAEYRFIPATAGNGLLPPCSLVANAVHPRDCGERNSLPFRHPVYFGSSPRLRGTGLGGHAVDSVDRFIPASAGNGA